MERLFSALANKDRLWIVLRLAAEGPTRQKDLLAALKQHQPERKGLNSGVMSKWIKELKDAGLVRRDRQQDAVHLANNEQVGRLLALASALTTAATTEAQRAAEAQHDEVMRAITTVHHGQAATG
jgi:DNA-binding HxlR family transcriptional regulator